MAHFAQIENGIVVNVIVVDNNELLVDGIETESKGADFCHNLLGGVLVKKGAMLLSLKAQTNSLLDQLRSMNSNQGQYAQNNEPQQQYQPPVNEVNPQTNNMSSVSFEEAGLTSDEEMLDIERVIETRE